MTTNSIRLVINNNSELSKVDELWNICGLDTHIFFTFISFHFNTSLNLLPATLSHEKTLLMWQVIPFLIFPQD